MAVDLKEECTRPLALILAALAALGWVLFAVSSLSAASVQRTQRLQIVDLNAKSEKLSVDLAKQVEASGQLADLQGKVSQTREELSRGSQTRADVQSELATAQRGLLGIRRDLTEADRNLQTQSQKLADLQGNAEATAAVVTETPQITRSTRRGRRWSRRSRRR